MDRCAGCELRSSEHRIDEIEGCRNIVWRLVVEGSSKHVTNSAMQTFTDSIALRVLDGRRHRLDAQMNQQGLELGTDKFGAGVVDATQRARVTAEPLSIKQQRHCAAVLVGDANDFGQAGASVDDRERPDREDAEAWDVHIPRANEVDSDFLPRDANIIPWRKLAVASADILVALATVTAGHEVMDSIFQLERVEVATDGAESPDFATVHERQVIPSYHVVDDRLRQDNPELVVGGLLAD